MSDTTTAVVTVLNVAPVRAGALVALADVEIEVDGIAFVIHGVRVVKAGLRGCGVTAPLSRGVGGCMADAVSLPLELAEAVAQAVLDEYQASTALAGRLMARSR